MSRFTPTVQEEVEFEGEVHKIEFRRITRKDMMELSSLMPEGEPSAKSNMEMVDGVLRLMIDKERVVKFNSPSTLTFEEISEESYFMPLLGSIVGLFMASGRITEDDAKNSDAESEDGSKDSAQNETEKSSDCE